MNTVPPPPPVHFYGRDEYVARIIELVTQQVSAKRAAHLVIRGPGGIGKTSVALAVFHHHSIDTLFREERYFVRCEAAETASLLLVAIASSLDVDLSQGNALKLVIGALNARSSPILLLLDNAETCWYSSHREHIRTILQHISAMRHVTLMITMRGTELPNVAPWNSLEPLERLSVEAARETFLAIAREQQPDHPLDRLLEEVDRIPLAVTLLARISQTSNDNPTDLRKAWLCEHTELLKLGSVREDNLEVSIKLSLESQPMKESSLALRLLSIISYLPDGVPIADVSELTSLQPNGLRDAAHTLKRLSLAHDSPSVHLTTLSPIRAYVRRHHHVLPSDIQAVHDWYLRLADLGVSEPGDPEFLEVSDRLTAEKGNLAHIFSNLISSNANLDNLSESVLNYSNFLYFTTPNGELLQQLLQNAPGISLLSKAKLFQRLGDIIKMQGDYEGARNALAEARTQFESVRSRVGAAQCLQSLGDIMRIQNDFEDARAALSEARREFQSIGNRLGAAQSLQSLGDIMRMQNNYDGARTSLSEARREFRSIGDRFGFAQCLWSLGNIMMMQDGYEGARATLSEARGEFQSIGSRIGAVQCLRTLGDIMMMQDDNEGARGALSEAKGEFQSLGSRLGAAQCLQSLSNIMRMQSDYEGARSALLEAKGMFEFIGYPLGASQCLESLSDIITTKDV